MKLYLGNKVLLSFRIPHSWKKVLVADAREHKTIMNNIISDLLEKKFRYVKIDKPEATKVSETHTKANCDVNNCRDA
jgi:hypothetical protein